jgi:hypothetical protein
VKLVMGSKALERKQVARVELETVTWRERLRRISGFLAWRLRPKFLKDAGQPVRLRWWICYQIMKRLDVQIRDQLAMGRQLMLANHDAGRTSPAWMAGKRMAMRARVLEARMVWLAYEGGAQFYDGSSRIELLHFAGMDIVRNPRAAR